MQSNNNVIIAAAGSHKTQSIIQAVIDADPNEQILITTYTNENLSQITNRIISALGSIPPNVTVMSWFSFLLRDCIKPYQNFLTSTNKVRSLNFQTKPHRFAKKSEPVGYYIDSGENLYSDNVSDFAVSINAASGGKTISRLEKIYKHIYVDEIQDLVGFDLDLLDLMMESQISITMVGDPRQSTYATSRTRRHKSYQGLGLTDWFIERQKKEICDIEWRTVSYRCKQSICDFADNLYPALPRTASKNLIPTGHDGVFTITHAEVASYMSSYNPVVMRHSRSSNTLGYAAINFGASKGNTYDRVLIFPTEPMKKYLKTKDLNKAGDISKFYVAVTRAKHSVVFVV